MSLSPMLPQRPVAIFWDFENCHPPSQLLGYDIAENIRRVAHGFGPVTLFRAYLEVSEQSAKTTILRSELQNSGVSLIDCPHSGRKDVVDKMILVDMLAYAIDQPPPATVVLISGDRDYAYAVSTLRLRRYNVALIVPPVAPASLKSQASVVIDWNDIIGKRTIPVKQLELNTDNFASSLTEAPERPTLLSPSPMFGEYRPVGIRDSHESPISSHSHYKSKSNDSTLKPSTSFIKGSPDHRGRARSLTTTSQESTTKPPSLSDRVQETRVSTPTPDVSKCRPPAIHENSTSSSSSVDPLNLLEPPPKPSTKSPTCTTAPLPPSNLVRDTERAKQVDILSQTMLNRIGGPNRPETGIDAPPIAMANSHCPEVTVTVASDPPGQIGGIVGRDSEGVWLGAPVVGPTPSRIVYSHQPRSQSLPVKISETSALTVPARPHPVDDIPRGCINVPSIGPGPSTFAGGPPPQYTALNKSAPPFSLSRYPPVTKSDPTHSSAANAHTQSTSTKHVPPHFQATSAPAVSPQTSTVMKPVLPHFQLLVDILLQDLANGVDKPSRSNVAMKLVAIDKDIYLKAQTDRFRTYCMLAENKGIIVLGGKEGDAWIALHPNWLK